MKYLLLLFIIIVTFTESRGQGCVAIRSNGSSCSIDMQEHNSNTAGWIFSLNERYFRSFRHFIGKEEQKQRVDQGTEVINHVFSSEMGLTRVINPRWSVSLNVPVTSNTRSSLYEHDGKNRYATHSFGLGDIRFAAYYWLLDPVKYKKANVQAGIGLKLPTGDYRYMDYFHKNDSTHILGPVDQSIQLGDGGTGITTEINAYYRFSGQLGAYANAFYLINPREQNGVSTSRGGTTAPSSLIYGSDVMSVPDQYMVRTGASYYIEHMVFSAGIRMECVPAKDLIGGSNGFRRPGYVLSAEPVVSFKTHKTQFYISVPYAIERNRTQSVPDKIRTEKTGVYFKGDAAFADYTINFGIACSLR